MIFISASEYRVGHILPGPRMHRRVTPSVEQSAASVRKIILGRLPGLHCSESGQRSREGHAVVQAVELRQATAAAMSIASSLGLAADDAIVLQDSNKLTLRLLPCDV